jgi:hypothetical protein
VIVEKRQYSIMLRAIGDMLDQDSSGLFTIVELRDGFLLAQSSPDIHAVRRHEVILSYTKLEELGAVSGDTRRAPSKGKVPAPESLSSRSWHDTLRALGYELDEAEAASILIDQMEDLLIVSYGYVDATRGYMWHKRAVYLQSAEIETILETARARRRVEQESRFRLWRR